MSHPFSEPISDYSIATSRKLLVTPMPQHGSCRSIRSLNEHNLTMFGNFNQPHGVTFAFLRAVFDIHLIYMPKVCEDRKLRVLIHHFGLVLSRVKLFFYYVLRKMCRLTEFLLGPRHGYPRQSDTLLPSDEVSFDHWNFI